MEQAMRPFRPWTRRGVLRAGLAAVPAGVAASAAVSLIVSPAEATPEAMQEAIKKIVGNAEIKKGRVKLELPPLSENGNSVSCAVTVESPMTAADHVKAIHVFNEKNPQPNVISVHLGPRAGKARIDTRIRLNDTQTVTAIAQMSDGTFWSAAVNVIVTLGACLEDNPT
jgi:sulfur-oxidizing protein SoxY